MRWTVALAVAVSVVLAAACLISKLGGNDDLARSCVRGLRYLITAELALLTIFSLVGVSYERRARAQDAAQFHPARRLVDIGGYRLHLYCIGRGGPTVVLEHGHQATYLDWFRVQPQIAAFTRVCSYDRGGYGWSDRSPKERIPSVMAEELHALLSAAGEKPPYIVVGHSFGAMNVTMFAHKFPNDVSGVVLVDGSTPETLHRAPLPTRLWIRMMQFAVPFGLPRWRGWCQGGPQEISAIRQAVTCRAQNFETVLDEDVAFPRAVNDVKPITNLGSIPLVVIARDPNRGQESAAEAKHNQLQRETAKLSTNSRFVVATGSGHDVPLARPDVVAGAVKSLLRPAAQAGSRETP